MIEILDYATSPFNPTLKIVIFIIFLAATGIYFYTRQYFDSNIGSFIDMMALFSLFAALGAFLRIFGHGIDPGYTDEYSLKWLQSISYALAGGFFLSAGKKLHNLFEEETG